MRRGDVSREALGWFAAGSAVALGSAAMLASAPARAENWTVTPAVGVTETYTTNAALGPSGQQEDSFVTTLTGSVAINGTGARARLNGFVALQGVVYTGLSELNKLYPQANLLGNIEAIEKFFFVEGAINVSQTYLSPFGPQPVGNVGATDNRYTTAAYRVSPYIQGVLPGADQLSAAQRQHLEQPLEHPDERARLRRLVRQPVDRAAREPDPHLRLEPRRQRDLHEVHRRTGASRTTSFAASSTISPIRSCASTRSAATSATTTTSRSRTTRCTAPAASGGRPTGPRSRATGSTGSLALPTWHC